MTANLIAFAWGFAEATLFFFVPDVALSIIALKSVEDGLVACLYALGGALLGGAVMYYWGKRDLKGVIHILNMIPAIRSKDIEKVRSDIEKKGVAAMLFGPMLGIPYKIYAAFAHEVSTIIVFLVISIPARVIRFIVVTLITPQWFKWLLPDESCKDQVWIVLVLWGIFYVGYFWTRRK